MLFSENDRSDQLSQASNASNHTEEDSQRRKQVIVFIRQGYVRLRRG